MGRGAAKIAFSLPQDLLREVEKTRRRQRRTRSAVVQEALRLWLDRQRDASLVREWEDGYRRSPETRAEIDAAAAGARFAFDPEDDW